ncbi:hypothetical protein [Pimelobacter simplex]|uniref:hypothetical protein n=1 Tax=Nocardioides simplex TaxID=2045 RepID=UPI003AAC35AD
MPEFKAGDRVYVTDAALAQLREIMRRSTGQEPAPNHHGTVEEIWPGGDVLIHFDDGVAAPYPAPEVRHLTEEATR